MLSGLVRVSQLGEGQRRDNLQMVRAPSSVDASPAIAEDLKSFFVIIPSLLTRMEVRNTHPQEYCHV